jgi:hypothetical protein
MPTAVAFRCPPRSTEGIALMLVCAPEICEAGQKVSTPVLYEPRPGTPFGPLAKAMSGRSERVYVEKADWQAGKRSQLQRGSKRRQTAPTF